MVKTCGPSNSSSFGKFGSPPVILGRPVSAQAVVGLAFTGRAFKLGRAAYFLTMGLSSLFTGMTSLFVLALRDAVKNHYLTVIVALIIGSLIPIAHFHGHLPLQLAREMPSAHGTDGSCPSSRSRTWCCCCAPPQEQRKTKPPCALQGASCWSFWVWA